nr:pirin family protein [uncultured Clostridium sp.]
MKRKVIKQIQGQRAVDGAGVSLVRVIGYNDVKEFDPFLMMDSFDSTSPSDYVAGFPMHPHRGIETVTYLVSGRIDHKDSLGNSGSIHSGECQWMTAGSGILHEEMPKESGRMLGLQLWLNLPASEKMAEPAYLPITKDMIPRVSGGSAKIGVLSGSYEGGTGVKPRHIPVSIYDIELEKGGEITLPVKEDETVFVFLLEGDGIVDGKTIASKSAVLFGEGDSITVGAAVDSDLRFVFFSGKPLHEPIAWGGPIVMNTQEELSHAFDELRKGTFIKTK